MKALVQCTSGDMSQYLGRFQETSLNIKQLPDEEIYYLDIDQLGHLLILMNTVDEPIILSRCENTPFTFTIEIYDDYRE